VSKLPYDKPVCGPNLPHALTPTQAKSTLANRFGPIADRLRQLATNFGIRPYRVFLTWTKWTGVERGQGTEVMLRRAEILPTPLVVSLDNQVNSPMHAGVLPVGTLRVSRISVASFSRDILLGKALPGDNVTVHTDGLTPAPDCLPFPGSRTASKPLDANMGGGLPPIGQNDGMTEPGYPAPANQLVLGNQANAPQVFDGDALPFGMNPREKHIPEPVDFYYEVVEDGRHDLPPKRMRFRPYGEPMLNAGNVEWTLMLERESEDRTRFDESAITTGLE
jgi:hypothetical protein